MKNKHGHVAMEKAPQRASRQDREGPTPPKREVGEQLSLGLPVVKKERRAPAWVKEPIRQPERTG